MRGCSALARRRHRPLAGSRWPSSGRAEAIPRSPSRRLPPASTTPSRAKPRSRRCSTASAITSSARPVPHHRHCDGAADHRLHDARQDGGHRHEGGRVQRLDVLDGRRVLRDDAGDRRHRRPVIPGVRDQELRLHLHAPAVLPRAGQGVRPAERGARPDARHARTRPLRRHRRGARQAECEKTRPALPGRHRPRHDAHHDEAIAPCGRHARPAAADRHGAVDRRCLHEHPVPRQHGRHDRRPQVLRRRRAAGDRHVGPAVRPVEGALRPLLVRRHGAGGTFLLGARRWLGHGGDGRAAERDAGGPSRSREGPRHLPARRARRGRDPGRHGPLAPAARQDRQLPGDIGERDVHLCHRARRQPRVAAAVVRADRAVRLARPRDARPARRPDRWHLRRHHRGVRRGVLLQSAHRR